MEDAVFALGAGLKLFAVSAAAVWLGWIALRRAFSQLHLIWAGFCVGLIAIMLIEVLGREMIGAAYPVMAIASCASCSFFWLTSRALFRHDAAIGWPEMAIVAGIFLPTIFDQLALGLSFGAWMGEASLAQWMERLDGLQVFFSSAALLLAFGEGLNGWSGISDSEKRIRYIFLSSFGAGVVICVMLFDHGRLTFVSPGLTVLIQGLCAAMIVCSVSLAIIFRQKNPLPSGAARKTPPATGDEMALARRAQALVAEGAYLDPELKVSTLAQRLHEKDYKVSRAIVSALGHPNFNRFINGYRIRHAEGLLADTESSASILDIALDSGFASLGPFNRAFKEANGLTPREYRRQKEKAATGAGGGLSSSEVFAE
jgi:AraC-like DNA-binding protein